MPHKDKKYRETAKENPHNVSALAGLIRGARDEQRKQIETMFADDPQTNISLDEETHMGPKKKKK